jgi:hypothetical protein
MHTRLKISVVCFLLFNMLNYRIEVLRVHEGTASLRLTYILSMVAGGLGQLLYTFLVYKALPPRLAMTALLTQAIITGASAAAWIVFVYQTSFQRAVCEAFSLHCQSRLFDACALLAILSTASSTMLYRSAHDTYMLDLQKLNV